MGVVGVFWARRGFGRGRRMRGGCLGRGGREFEFGLFGFGTLVLLGIHFELARLAAGTTVETLQV